MKNIFDGITADELRLYMEHVKEEEIGDRQLRYLAERGNLIGYDKAEACRQAIVLSSRERQLITDSINIFINWMLKRHSHCRQDIEKAKEIQHKMWPELDRKGKCNDEI